MDCLIILMAVALSPASRPAAPATTAPAMAVPVTGAHAATGRTIAARAAAATAPATQPSLAELHVKAVASMKAGDMNRAREVLDLAWKRTPPERRSRALVLNRAVVDLSSPAFVMRGLRDLTEYLVAHPEGDELATNVLGSALDVAAYEPRLRAGRLWQAALREWERRNEQLDGSRPGFCRWGPRWLSEQEYADLRARQKEWQKSIRAQQKIVEAALHRVGASESRAAVGAEFVDRVPIEWPGNRDRLLQWRMKYQMTLAERKQVWKQEDAWKAREGAALRQQARANQRHAAEVGAAVARARADAQLELDLFDRLIAEQPRPEWPRAYEPVVPPAEDAP